MLPIDAQGYRRRTSKKAVAIHEAGHFFANLHFQPSPWVDQIWIEQAPNRAWCGAVEFQRRFQWRLGETAEAARIELLVSLAGPIAELRWRGRSRWAAILAGPTNAASCLSDRNEPHTDFGQVRRYIEWLGEPDATSAFQDAWIEAEEIVHRYWQLILLLGAMLKERESLMDAELYALPEIDAVRIARLNAITPS